MLIFIEHATCIHVIILKIAVWCKSWLRVEDCTLPIIMIIVYFLYIVTWMESCLIGTHTPSFYSYTM